MNKHKIQRTASAHTWATLLILLWLPRIALSQPVVNADSLGFGNIFIWNTPILYVDVLGYKVPNSRIDVHVYSHPLSRNVVALAVRKNSALQWINVNRNGTCFIANPAMFVASKYLMWRLIWYADPLCASYNITLANIRQYVQHASKSNTTQSLDTFPHKHPN